MEPPSDELMEGKKKKPNPVLLGCGALLLLAVSLGATVAATVWWIQRPIRPVVLSPDEKVTVEKKIQEIEGGGIPLAVPATSALSPTPTPKLKLRPDPRTYEAGSKRLVLTEREVNGLLNLNTDLGNKVRLEFAQDAINAYMAIPIPQDFPIGAGTTLRMRGRFRVSIGGEGKPYAVIEDVTIFGLSLPKAWLGGIKGENLLGEALGGGTGVNGIKSLKVEPGALVLEVDD